jgi:TPP-dependent pyruvate/acetoin dehydrogenase alpha subunit
VAPSPNLRLSPDLLVLVRPDFHQAPATTENTSDIASRAAAYGMPGERVDGNDVLAVHAATKRAVERARAGEGPSLVEGFTMRMHGHAEHDPATYVPRELLEEWTRRDPIEAYERRLKELGYVDDEHIDKVKAAARQRVLENLAKVREAPMPDPATVEEGVYAP